MNCQGLLDERENVLIQDRCVDPFLGFGSIISRRVRRRGGEEWIDCEVRSKKLDPRKVIFRRINYQFSFEITLKPNHFIIHSWLFQLIY